MLFLKTVRMMDHADSFFVENKKRTEARMVLSRKFFLISVSYFLYKIRQDDPPDYKKLENKNVSITPSYLK